MVERSPEEQSRVDDEFRRIESHFADEFSAMDTDQFIEQGVSIFRSAADGIPVVNEGADNAVRVLLDAVVKAEAPQPFMGGRTAAAWRMYTQELIKRASSNQGVEFREVPLESVPVPYYRCDGWKPEDASREIVGSVSLAERILANFRIGGPDYIRAVASEIENVWFEELILKQKSVSFVVHREEATRIAGKYETCFSEMVEKDDASILRRGLSDHDFSHVAMFVSINSHEVDRRRTSKK